MIWGMAHDLGLVRSVISTLDEAGLSVVVFGGRAEDLWGHPSRAHRDIDLLVIDPDDTALGLVELFILRHQGGEYASCFWNELVW
jgi:predicted nucleotidyltransferase